MGTTTEAEPQRPVLLVELINVTEKLTDPLPYHSQLNICHDIALARRPVAFPQRPVQYRCPADWRR